MTTPPKVRRYHALAAESVRLVADGPGASAPPARPAPDARIRLHAHRSGGRRLVARAATCPPASASADDIAAQLEGVRKENLSERQLRIARRIATLHQIKVASDEEAVLRLRQRGIDRSHRAALGQILSSEGARAQAKPAANTPAVMPRI